MCFRYLFALISLFCLPVAAVADEGRLPNIVLILADDLGYETIGAYAAASYKTPNIDRLAADGMQFMNAHANPLCSPSRVKLLTGKSNAANYIHFANLPKGESTLAHLLKQAGYRTYMTGKWQLANQDGQTPVDAGFDSSCIWDLRQEEKGSRYWDPKLHIKGEELQVYKDQYGPDLIQQCALDFLAEDDERPFFLFYSFLLTHKPFTSAPGSNAFKHQTKFHSMVEYMDKLVGQLMKSLDDKGLAENTLVLFIGDNGTDHEIHSKLMDGRTINGGKGQTTNTGTHVPFIVRWPGNVAPGSSFVPIIDISSVYPTLETVSHQAQTLTPQYSPGLFGVLTGNPESFDKDWVYIHYDPAKDHKEINFSGITHKDSRAATYAMDLIYKLYDDGRYYDLRVDSQQKQVLSLENLTDQQKQHYIQLKKVLERQGVYQN